ncbi:hypothetical protein IAU60_004567 [Kwoniella sp. DSM 27419]
MSDPNFPPNLDIHPLQSGSSLVRSTPPWNLSLMDREATRPLLEYFTPSDRFEPPCPLLADGTKRIIELGSGQSVASLQVASQLNPDDLVILTDLPEVIPLCDKAIAQATPGGARVIAEPLAWGGDVSRALAHGPFTHILMCDLTPLDPKSFYHVRTMASTYNADSVDTSRTLALEESFFNSLALYFQTTPVRGGDWEAKVFICRRWRVTSDWTLPDVNEVMNGGRGVIRGRSYDLVDDLFGALEWEV